MADPKQLRILKMLCAHLQLTTGYTTMKVIRGVAEISSKWAADNEFVLSILEAPQPITGTPAGEAKVKRNENWALLLQGWPVDDKDNPSDPAYMMKAAIEQQLAKLVTVADNTGVLRTDSTYLLGGEIRDMTIGQGVVRPAGVKGESRLAMFYLPLTIGLITDSSNPYA